MRDKRGDGLGFLKEMLASQRFEKLEAEVRAVSQQLAKLLAGPTEEKLLTSKEIAPFVGVLHHKTVEKWVRDKKKRMPCVRLGRNLRFRLGDVLAWRAQRKEG